MQNNKIQKAKFSRVCSINLELTTDDRSRRFYFNEQFQWTLESWTVSQSLRNLAPMLQLPVISSLREHKFSYLLTYLRIHAVGIGDRLSHIGSVSVFDRTLNIFWLIDSLIESTDIVLLQ